MFPGKDDVRQSATSMVSPKASIPTQNTSVVPVCVRKCLMGDAWINRRGRWKQCKEAHISSYARTHARTRTQIATHTCAQKDVELVQTLCPEPLQVQLILEQSDHVLAEHAGIRLRADFDTMGTATCEWMMCATITYFSTASPLSSRFSNPFSAALTSRLTSTATAHRLCAHLSARPASASSACQMFHAHGMVR